MSAAFPDDLAAWPVQEIAARVSAREMSAEAVTKFWLERIAARDGDIGAWAYLDAGRALAEARAVDAIADPLPLKGVPIGVKDVIDTADMPTCYGSAAYPGIRPAADAACVALARAAGAVVLGKTVTTEFATASPGKTRNPHHPVHTPGGSSSGSAAAVAAGMVPVAFGTQTAGSIIRPASYCGAVGYKPSFGLISRVGVKALADSLDTVGVMAGRVADAAYFTSVLAGRPAMATPMLRRPPRIGLYDIAGWESLSSANAAALRQAEHILRQAGATIISIPRLALHEALLGAQQAVMDWEVSDALAYERTQRFDELTQITQGFVSRPRPLPDDYDIARRLTVAGRTQFRESFGDCDAWLAPAAPGVAPATLGNTGDPIFNRLWTLLHAPCLTVPCIMHAGDANMDDPLRKLPVGVQVIGRQDKDMEVLAVGLFLEKALADIGVIFKERENAG